MTQDGQTQTYFWDATKYVATLVADEKLGDEGLHATEASALSALAMKAKTSKAKTLSITVFYKRLAAQSAYGTPTYAGKVKLFAVTSSRDVLQKNEPTLARDLAAGRKPAQIQLVVSGALPPAQ